MGVQIVSTLHAIAKIGILKHLKKNILVLNLFTYKKLNFKNISFSYVCLILFLSLA